MTTITVMITHGRSWYVDRVGENFPVQKDGRHEFAVTENGKRINKNDCVVTAVCYEDETAGNGRPMVGNWRELE